MIPNKTRRIKAMKLPKNLERVYKEGKCRECAVVLTRMDFAKILGKFTKVKIQYEVSSSTKGKSYEIPRLKRHENGVIHKINNDHKQPAKEVSGIRRSKTNDTFAQSTINNVLKENNRIKSSIIKDKNSNYESKSIATNVKQYGIVFTYPIPSSNYDAKTEITLVDLLPNIDNSVLPSEDWYIDYFPKNEEPKDDKVYDRIAAELEDLMNSGKPLAKSEDKVDDFPSIMDILNDNGSGVNKSSNQGAIDFKPDLESNDVEAILLGKSNNETKPASTPMEVDNTDMSSLIPDVEQFNAIQPVVPSSTNLSEATNDIENPHSPSILDETLQKGIEEHLPPSNHININQTDEHKPNELKSLNNSATQSSVNTITQSCGNTVSQTSVKGIELHEAKEVIESNKCVKNNTLASRATIIAQIVFKKTKHGQCEKSVTCMKDLKYSVELNGKCVELLGAPKIISSLKDLQVLLQIVNESELESFYVLQ